LRVYPADELVADIDFDEVLVAVVRWVVEQMAWVSLASFREMETLDRKSARLSILRDLH
jgi:hypothetical protein